MNQFFTLTGASLDYPLPVIVFNILFGLLLGVAVALVYQRTHKGLSYSASFTFTLALLTAAGSILMMIVGNSLARAFSLFGAFSIIRFRTAVKDARDIAFVFIALITGMAVGTNNYTIAVVSTLFISLAVVLMTRYRFGSITASDHLLTFHYPEHSSTDKILKLFTRHLKNHQLLNLTSFKQAKTVELAYNITLKPETDPKTLMQNLKAIKGVDSIRLVSLENNPVS
ncbi:MAG: hypothetical protein UX85_C0006G0007 [Candidatus Beckwithbacteria bacterium GW2011_GWB1_47_15]|uniref:DUF4956 domain-containing protein n=1 Tax=Candidatus Beckwithbacteria bacterium GW2011_GWB1_47_15 TaxID=1618371 RepID=A0A0G1U3E5_9BACT|nr:MAG: hypothetical protein UY43_C0001G0696 [Candidatus Beckwithbacteria bacterium GW2011_GWC1_49_16]KKU35674.1 MAG: hypothetical protein UX50_C0002G0101 [Candidatus Beckwithbacteria bacterium GW2011_GWA1_46_30]KKU60873.1 MAG: hypothetical protein UX85_C0006G0007 [Candidatus Beckwithbacteria bacterium GW2011_GWB1_47_15]KKU72233.1 MAG: hypothetical protein UX97_C0001G0103 [Candidatus Beckwithbacteria bacterium GW2011_GWA2_47_25]KKW05007.1 MAG: hypothetical protein UY37_C0001G0111 [Candidatus Be